MSDQITAQIPKSTNIFVFEYGCRLDHEAQQQAGEQIRMARELYNGLVACMCAIHADMSAWVLTRGGDAVQRAQAQVTALSEAFDTASAHNDGQGMTLYAAERRRAQRELTQALKEVHTAHRAEIRNLFLSRIGIKSTCDTYRLRCDAVRAGLGWATANEVLDRAMVAWQASMRRGRPPRYARFDDKTQDSLTLQFNVKGGLAIERVLDGSHVEIGMTVNGDAARRRYGELRFKLGSAAAGTYATGTWQYHRPVPRGAFVTSARLVRRRLADKNKWAVQLVVRVPDAPLPPAIPLRTLAAVHFGWAADAEGRRLAGIATDADPCSARLLRLDPSIEADLERASAVQSQRDNARVALVPLLKELVVPECCDETLRSECLTLQRLPAQSVTAQRLYRLQLALREALLPPIEWLDQFIAEDRKRWQSAVGIARRARQRRRNFYRVEAKRLAMQHSAVVIEPPDLAAAAKKLDELTGEKTKFHEKARAGRFIAAIHELELAIRQACSKYGTALFEFKGRTVQECAHCGSMDTITPADHRLVQCKNCGAVTDRKLAGAARAWQEASTGIDERIVDFHAKTQIQAEQAAAVKEKILEKVQAKRRQTSRSEGSSETLGAFDTPVPL